ncbi:MAG: methyltransferase domain-containing protein [Epsilonproteobacteria bacterium]|nr:methyltransferase domain-containing protein [Campylobacterota bacterium]
MSKEDKQRWNKKYQDNPIPDEPIELVTKFAKLATGSKALDIACGMGRHSKFLASQRFEVDALDVSSVAIDSLQGLENINAKEVDFDHFTLAKNAYDLIVTTYFLHRPHFNQMREALREDGILIFETFIYHLDNERVPSNRAFLLEEGELELAFDDTFDLLHIREFWDEDMQGVKTMKASMVAKKKRGGMSDEDFWA